jgi:hypothetical protein
LPKNFFTDETKCDNTHCNIYNNLPICLKVFQCVYLLIIISIAFDQRAFLHPDCQSTSQHSCLPVFQPTCCMPTCQPACLTIYLLYVYLPAYLPAYLSTCLSTYLLYAYPPVCMSPDCHPTCWLPTCKSATYLSAYLLAFLNTCKPVCLPICPAACLTASLPATTFFK